MVRPTHKLPPLSRDPPRSQHEDQDEHGHHRINGALADHLCRCGNPPVSAPGASQAGPRAVYPVGSARSSQALLSGGMKRTRKTTYAATSQSRRREARILSDVRELGEFESRHAGDKRILRRMAKRGTVVVVLSKSGWFRPPALKAFLTRADALIQYDKSLILRP